MSTDARHTITMVLLATYLSRRKCTVHANYMHRTPVEIARNDLFLDMMERDAGDIFFSLDSDTYIDPGDIHELGDRIIWCFENNVPFVGVATQQRDGNLNVWPIGGKPGERMKTGDKLFRKIEPQPVHAIGFGAAILNFFVLRRHFADRISAPFKSIWGTSSDGKDCFESEDYYFTSRLEGIVGEPPRVETLYFAKHLPRGRG